ncbi:MAG TPA: dTDP-4-dehydrorhamnose reductase [Kofleriaceae bacterium]|nr:dTDP-4-dehydrorhamnose reductase [Kofleriaceae bacterium]
MNILVTGGKGQLGRAVARRGAAGGHTVRALDVDELDICDEAQIVRALDPTPDLVINAAAYTAVDKAETERDRAFAINATGAGLLARACAARRVRLLHVSTDYVFDGQATRPYREDDPIAPQSVYGASKAEGERLVRDAGGVIVRTSWLFEQKGPSFVHTMLRLAKERPLLRVVADQRGCPTWADDLADGLIALTRTQPRDAIYHYCNAEPTTWHGFAQVIVELARAHTQLACERVEAITTADYPLPAKRPAYSILDTSRIAALGIVPPSWRAGLATVIAQELS